MTSPARPRRIAVALDASPGSREALMAAARLAARGAAELIGVHVADADLLRWATLPFASAVGRTSAAVRAPDLAAIRRHLERQRQEAERMLAEAAERWRVRATFRSVEGQVAETLLAAWAEVDLLVAGKGAAGLGSVALRLLQHCERAQLLLAAERPIAGGVALAVGGAPPGRAALELAAELVETGEVTLLSLGGASDPPEGWPAAGKRSARQLEVPAHDMRRIARLARQAGAGVLVLPARQLALEQQVVEVVVRRFPGTVLIATGS